GFGPGTRHRQIAHRAARRHHAYPLDLRERHERAAAAAVRRRRRAEGRGRRSRGMKAGKETRPITPRAKGPAGEERAADVRPLRGSFVRMPRAWRVETEASPR